MDFKHGKFLKGEVLNIMMDKLPFNLQFFAGDSEAEGEPAPDGNLDNDTEKDYVKMTQSELDDLIAKQKARAKKQGEREATERFQKQQKDKEFAKLDEQERMKREFEEMKQENESLRNQQKINQTKADVRSSLQNEGYMVDDDMLSMIVSTDSEQTLQNVDVYKRMQDKMHSHFENERARGVTPKSNGQVKLEAINQETFNKMSYAERAKLYETNKELYQKLMKGDK